jgi:hypothetical protein
VRVELANAFDRAIKILNLDENQSKNPVADQLDDQSEKIIQPRRFDRKRRASKLAERMIQYDPRKKNATGRCGSRV